MKRCFYFPTWQTPLFLMLDGLERDSVLRRLKSASKYRPSEADQGEDKHGELSGTNLNQAVMGLWRTLTRPAITLGSAWSSKWSIMTTLQALLPKSSEGVLIAYFCVTTPEISSLSQHLISHTASESQKSNSGLFGWFWIRVSHEVAAVCLL